MSFQGHVENGVIVFDEPVSLAEGTKVRVEEVSATPTGNIKPGTGDWQAALQAARELENYDFDAWRKQREYDLEHARDHQL